MNRLGFNPIGPFNSLFNGQQRNLLLNGAKDGLKSVTCGQAFNVRVIAVLPQINLRQYGSPHEWLMIAIGQQ